MIYKNAQHQLDSFDIAPNNAPAPVRAPLQSRPALGQGCRLRKRPLRARRCSDLPSRIL